jgi:inhibitor of cysteine peptidase
MPYTINNQTAAIGQEPVLRNDRLYVPLTEVVNSLGGQTSWDNEQKVATATIGQWTATIRMADRNIDVSGTPVTLAADPYVEQDVMWVPVTFFRDAFGYEVEADPRSGSIAVRLPQQ